MPPVSAVTRPGLPAQSASAPPPELSAHIEQTVEAIAQFHAEHRNQATPIERAVDRVTRLLGHPGLVGVLTGIVVVWVGLNLIADPLGYRPVDPPPFAWLEVAISLLSLYMVLLVLAAQRRDDKLARHRELLILELALLSEQKTTKVIQLLEESRRENPLVSNRVDAEAEGMSAPADPGSVLQGIKQVVENIEAQEPKAR